MLNYAAFGKTGKPREHGYEPGMPEAARLRATSETRRISKESWIAQVIRIMAKEPTSVLLSSSGNSVRIRPALWLNHHGHTITAVKFALKEFFPDDLAK
jgi:hypothetical protein